MSPARKRISALTARTADRHALYEIAVQRPQIIVGFIEELFETLNDRSPRLLREDFCGTANLASTWVASASDRRAVGIDLDGDVLEWAEQHNRHPLAKAQRRLRLIEDDVLDVHTPKADVLVSLNFSHFIYKTPEDLLAYLKHARRCIKPGGMMILDAFGGPGSITPDVDERPFSDFDYLWEQAAFNPLTNEIICHIHFRFRDGTKLRCAFTYHWRMWSLPELNELLARAGFGDIGIYFESEDGFIADIDAVNLDAWVAYLVVLRP